MASSAADSLVTGRASFICGTLSPVNDASFTTAVPFRMMQSHGMVSSVAAPDAVGAAGGALAPPAAPATPAAGAGVKTVALFCGARETMSPGSSSVMPTPPTHRFLRKTHTSKLFAVMPRSCDIDLRRWNAVEASKPRMDSRVNMFDRVA